MISLHLPWMAKHVCKHSNHWNCGFMRVWSFCWQLENVIIHWRTMDEMNITPFSSSRSQRLFEAVAWSESTIGLLTVQSQCVEDRVKTWFVNVTTSSTKQHPHCSNILHARHMTSSHPPTPHPPFCKQQRYLQRNNIFNEATSSL